MKVKILFIIMALALFLSCTRDPLPSVLTYEFEYVRAFPQANECIIRCKNNDIDNVHVFARVLLWAEFQPYNMLTFPMEGNQEQLSCHITGLRAGYKYIYSIEVYTSEDSYQLPEYYNFTTTHGSK